MQKVGFPFLGRVRVRLRVLPSRRCQGLRDAGRGGAGVPGGNSTIDVAPPPCGGLEKSGVIYLERLKWLSLVGRVSYVCF